MKTIKLTIFAVALSSVAAVAVAQNSTTPVPEAGNPEAMQTKQDQPRGVNRLERLDANKDGSVDQQEFTAAANIKQADTNADGTLSTDELVAMVQKRQAERQAERLTRRLDIDGDGQVTLVEIEKNKTERFALMDRNDDGKLEANELRGRHGGDGKFGRQGGRHDRDGRGGSDELFDRDI